MMNAFVENVERKIELPTPSKGKKSKKKVVAEPEISEPGVVYVHPIPRGFCKTEIKDYFSQFGEIRRLRLVRSSRTGRANGFAYIEFESKEVAKTVAKTMNNYLLFEKPLKCEYIPSNKVHPNDFKGWNISWPLRSEKNRQQQNAPKNEVQIN